jgi:hypothetical protein
MHHFGEVGQYSTKGNDILRMFTANIKTQPIQLITGVIESNSH